MYYYYYKWIGTITEILKGWWLTSFKLQNEFLGPENLVLETQTSMLYLLQNQSCSRNNLAAAILAAILNFSLTAEVSNVYLQFFKH